MNKKLLALAIGTAFLAAPTANAVDIVLVPGAGLNDPTPATPVGGNPGTTVGAQRRIAYEYAASLWGAVLDGDTQIDVAAQFTPLNCTPTGGVLGSAGATEVFQNFPNAPLADTWYSAALANQLTGQNLNGPAIDINSNFNANLGSPGCLENSGWYYGLDGQTPAGRIDFLNVVVHEIGHGLGFQSFNNAQTGVLFQGQPDMYNQNVFAGSFDQRWVELTNQQRASAAISDQLAWTGTAVNDEGAMILNQGVLNLEVTAPGNIAGPIPNILAAFGPPPTVDNFGGTVVAAVADPDPELGGAPNEGCGPFTNAGDVAGNIALVDRGVCPFTQKAINAQAAGASGILIADNTPNGVAPMGGADPNVTIPSVGTSGNTGAALRENAPATVGFVFDPDQLAGADAEGRVKTYAPATFAGGSSFSHFDTSLTPNAVMEPSITGTLRAWINLDLTPALYEDIGYTRREGTAVIGGCDTGVPLVQEGGIVPGAAILANWDMCQNTSQTGAQFATCVVGAYNRINASGFVTTEQARGFRSCVVPSRLLRQFQPN